MSNGTLSASEYLTTGAIAELLGVAVRQVASIIDSGELPGSLVPGSNSHRRVHRDDLAAYLRAHGYRRELARLGVDVTRHVLLVGTTLELAGHLGGLLPVGMAVQHAKCVIEAGALWERYKPVCVILDFSIGRADACACALWLLRPDQRPTVIGLLPEDWSPALDRNIRQYGFDRTVPHPADPRRVADLLAGLPGAAGGEGTE